MSRFCFNIPTGRRKWRMADGGFPPRCGKEEEGINASRRTREKRKTILRIKRFLSNESEGDDDNDDDDDDDDDGGGGGGGGDDDDECGEEDGNGTALEERSGPRKSSSEIKYKCDVCSKLFAKKYNLTAHKKALHSPCPKKHVCDVCGKSFSFKSNFNTHKYVHMDLPRNYKCSQCGSAFKNARGLKNHLKTHETDKNYVCEVCGKTFAVKINLKNHMSAHSEMRPHVCDLCKSAFKRHSHLHQHQKEVHGVNVTKMERKFTCDECQNSFTTSERLEVHKRKHTGELPFKCDMCWRGFASQMGLNVHHTMGLCQSKSSTCKTCQKMFKPGEEPCLHIISKRNRVQAEKPSKQKKERVLRKDKPRKFECDVCKKTFVFNCDLRNHYRTSHTNERPYVCHECGKAFKTKTTLQNHQAMHSDSRPFPCAFCDKKFRRSEQRMLHTRTHTGEKPHICSFCGRGFAQIGDMRKHRKIHNRILCQTGIRFGKGLPPSEIAEEGARDEENGALTYGETQVNLIRANIFKKQTLGASLKKWVKCHHCLSTFSTKASLTRHLKRFSCKEESRDVTSLGHLSLNEIKEAIYGPNSRRKRTGDKSLTETERPLEDVFDGKRDTDSGSNRKQLHLCPICGKQFSYRSSLVSHQMIHQKLPKSHVCGLCSAAFTTVRSLRRHQYTHYDNRDKEFICELCGKRFAYAMTLKNHKLSHSEERPYSCRICGTSFKRTSHLRAHEQGVHNLNDGCQPKNYTCGVCNKGMVKKESLEAHMKEHTGELNYKCSDCHKKFATNTGLNIHISMARCGHYIKSCSVCRMDFKTDEDICEHLKTKPVNDKSDKSKEKSERKTTGKKLKIPRHLKERNYFCKMCGKDYIYPCELKTHFRLTHTDEKPFVCGRCGKAFKAKASLQMHEDVHDDNRPHECNICRKRFRKTEHLKLHVRTHTGEKPHVCQVCGRGFTQKGDMKKHLLKTHKHQDYVPPAI